MDDIRLTRSGREALDPHERDPLDTATRKLRTGAKIEAMIIAVETALAPRLRALAEATGGPVVNDRGRPEKLSVVNDGLKGTGVITEADRSMADPSLKRRNDCAHGDDELVTQAQAELVITQVRVLLEKLQDR